MSTIRRLLFILVFLALLGLGFLALTAVGKGREDNQAKGGTSPELVTAGEKAAPASAISQAAPAGGVSATTGESTTANKSDDQANANGGTTAAAAPANVSKKIPDEKRPEYYGTFPTVSAQANESTRSVVEALKDKKHPERLTPLVPPKPYDDAAFERDKAAYCNTVEPGRIFQSAQPGADVPRLEMDSNQLQSVVQGEQVALQVHGVPGKPVTFCALDGGRFVENQLNTVTVVADGHGIAKVNYQATTGVINEVNIQAASPVASGNAKFTVYVSKPQEGTKP